MYQGFYNGTRKHESDLANVLARSRTCGVDKIIITGVNLEKSKEALDIAADDGHYSSRKLIGSSLNEPFDLTSYSCMIHRVSFHHGWLSPNSL